ncbi:T9SS type A sorting domain-containing protein [Mangrovimonas sp. TPBH4]|uniref:T9SS type A sorting domain-containing protein n=1 Tax=Mangrovimonas sp. TPBH4 TaxID=1645914 RepID=UPI0006B50164|nr:T9SS type A sorting domain-containing protein [Mangrovimonas sp. TPBH4]
MSKITFTALIFVLALQFSWGQSTIATIASTSGTTPTATGTVPNISASGFERGNGILNDNGSEFTSDDWDSASLNDAITSNEYIQWSLTSNTDYSMNISQLDIALDRHQNGPQNWQVFYSTDGFSTSSPVEPAQTITTTETTFSLTGLTINSGNSGTVTFRLYAWGANNTGGWLSIMPQASWTELGVTDPGARILGSVIPQTNAMESNIVNSSTFNANENIDYTAFNAGAGLTTSNAIKIAEFVIQDGGDDTTDADEVATILTDLEFTIAGFENLEALALFDGTQNLSELTVTGNTVAFSGLTLTANNDGTKTFEVYATFKSTVTDNEQIQLTITSANADSLGSGFAASDAGGAQSSIAGDANRIEVTATHLSFLQEPTDTNVNEIMTPFVMVAAEDSNGNIDADITSSITIQSTGALLGAPITVAPIDGIATFETIIHSTITDGYVINLVASNSELPGAFSAPFSIINGSSFLAFQSFEGGGTWDYTISPEEDLTSNNTYWGVADSSFGSFTTMPSEGSFFFGAQNTEGTISLETFSVSDYTEVSVSFDYEADAFDNNDFVQYELFIDNVSQGLIDLVVGVSSGQGIDQEGTVTLPITEGASTVRLNVTVISNNQNDFAAFDNFRIEGTPLPPPINYTYNGLIWDPQNPTGVSTDRDVILVQSGVYEMDADTEASVMLVSPGAGVHIPSGVTFTVINDLGLLSESDSYSSLILDGTINGTVTYERHVNTTASVGGNDLISAPLTGQQFGVFASNNDNIDFNPANPSMKRFGPFDKATGAYLYWDTDVLEEYLTTLDPGIGYRAASTDGNNFAFSGTVNTGTILAPIEQSGPSYLEWNAIGNPYPSYLSLSEFLNINNDLFLENSAGVYGYNSLGNASYTVWNLAYSDANPNAVITPGQGFLVTSKPEGGSVTFNPNMRSTGSSDDFIVGKQASTSNNSYFATFQVSNSTEQVRQTSLYLNDNASLGLDPGYDSAILGFNAASYDIYSELVQENNGIDMAIQSIGNTDILNPVNIPLGINAPQGQQLTISIVESTIPTEINVYLEDIETNTFTLLNTSDYTFTTSSTLTTPGRFYITFDNNTLSNGDNDLSNIEIFNIKGKDKLIIRGNLEKNTILYIYDIQGRLVLNSEVLPNINRQEIDISNVTNGVYVVKLENNTQEKIQKIIVD